jgi:hypothetical protein
MNLYLRKVIHSQARDNYRVVLKLDGEDEFEAGSIGIVNTTGAGWSWRWGIDTVIPMREIEAEGEGRDRADCMKQFKAAWGRLCSEPGRLAEFLEMKRRARRRP